MKRINYKKESVAKIKGSTSKIKVSNIKTEESEERI